MKMKVQLEVLRCPRHGLVAVAINDRRVSPAKCCGQWEHLIGWTVDAVEVRAALPSATKRRRTT
jgi:hypothetical protein